MGQLGAKPMSDVLGRPLPLMIGLLSFALISILCMLAPTVEILVTLLFLHVV